MPTPRLGHVVKNIRGFALDVDLIHQSMFSQGRLPIIVLLLHLLFCAYPHLTLTSVGRNIDI